MEVKCNLVPKLYVIKKKNVLWILDAENVFIWVAGVLTKALDPKSY